MRITILSVGKLKEKYLKQGIAEYQKRMQRYGKLEVIEVKDEPTPDNASDLDNQQIIEKEGQRLLAKISPQAYVIVLAIKGQVLSSEELAQQIDHCLTYGKSDIVFVIGGSLGTSPAVNQRADLLLSFGRMTLPHQLMRLVLSEQIYRAFRIIHHEPYHK
ncbi:23S rRNA (pseudouridine(1915)-N(3))-methyltransferase RlmH [Aerococcus urinae]